ncbi:MAG: hypothetical protein M3342_16745 [Bacteroidota bacterium]|nr:hypothetical protein [Bacteroidota bacterium]
MKLLCLLTIFSCLTAQAQPITRLKLYIDCTQSYCDFDYIRQQLPIVDFVQDRKESDFHILIITQRTGNGDKQYSLLFLGQGSLAASADTLFFFIPSTASQNEIREQVVKHIKAGLLPYLVKRGQLQNVAISFTNNTASQQTAESNKDKWNNWVFRIGGRAHFSGDKNYKEKNIGTNISASRVTDGSKIEFFLHNSTERNTYNLLENGIKTELKTRNEYLEAEQNYVKSLSRKWSLAFSTDLRKSTYDNLKQGWGTSVGVEYNLYPYTLSSTKFLVLRYELELNRRHYLEETIYNKTKETLFSNEIGLYAAFTQPWGNIRSGISWYHYLHDFSKNNLSVNAHVELQVFKGISFNLFGSGSLINDQLSLSKSGVSAEEILLRLKALSTSFNYYTGVGLTYRFGSRFNNFINPRFSNGN